MLVEAHVSAELFNNGINGIPAEIERSRSISVVVFYVNEHALPVWHGRDVDAVVIRIDNSVVEEVAENERQQVFVCADEDVWLDIIQNEALFLDGVGQEPCGELSNEFVKVYHVNVVDGVRIGFEVVHTG